MILEDSTVVATHAGPAFGKAASFQPESCRLLSVTYFLHHIQNYTGIKCSCVIDIYIDDKGLITCANNQIKYAFDYPFNTLEPDWDVIAQCAEHLCIYESNLKISYVKSHQDNNMPYEELNPPAKLNVDADSLATTYQIQYGTTNVHIHCLECDAVQSTHAKGTFTGHYFKTIHDIAMTKPLVDHIKDANMWLQETFDAVDWLVYQRSWNRMDQRDTQIIKLSHDILPTYYQVHKYDLCKPDKCTLYKTHTKTRDHILQCTSISVQ
eukprot:10531558-Ditylum_brightwellii.AAC.1